MNVLIFSGGSGSDSLQKGLYAKFPELDITVLTNAYDNGKSTGAIRQVFGGNILGPSDVRKNQSRHWALKKQYKDEVYEFIEHRFTSDDPEGYITNYFLKLEPSPILEKLYSIVQNYFKQAPYKSVAYEDFSIGNIIYGYLAWKHGNSLQKAADYMADLLSLDQETVLNSDESLFLQAITKSGKILHDEADIVEFCNEEDPIADIRFLTATGEVKETSFLSRRAIQAIDRADMIIFSTGTQWSSLIPTYKCTTEDGRTFAEIIEQAKAKKFFLVNGAQDKDMYGIDGDGIISIVSQYFDVSKTIIVSGETNIAPTKHNCHIEDFGGEKYDHIRLAKTLMWLYFDKPMGSDTFIFDYDDTIHGRKGSYADVSEKNKQSLPKNTYIITGNAHTRVDINVPVYAEGGANFYENGEFVKCLKDSVKVTEDMYNTISEFLAKHGFNISLLHNRNDACLSIKPVQDPYRNLIAECVNTLINDDFEAIPTGTSTIDILHKDNNKLLALDDIMSVERDGKTFYIGDEISKGNDRIIEKNKHKYDIITYEVRTPVDTLTFLKSIRRSL